MSCVLCCTQHPSNYSRQSDYELTAREDPIDAGIKGKGQYELIRKKCMEAGRLYEDPDFKPGDALLISSPGAPKAVWKRPNEIRQNPIFVNHGATYDDIDQQLLGDCWFLAPLASLLYKNPRSLLARIMPKDQNFGQLYCGAFHFRFFEDAMWNDVIIDDRLPTRNGSLIYTENRSQPNEFWMPLMEKAFAKFRGGYQDINGGRPDEAFKYLTGNDVSCINLREKEGKEAFTEKIVLFNSMNTVVAASVAPESTETTSKGLVTGHAYSILDARRVNTTHGAKTLLHIRNPWGDRQGMAQTGEWTGAWSDKSPLWKTVIDPDFTPEVSSDGEFWMDLQEFLRQYAEAYVVFLTDDVPPGIHQKNWFTKQLLGRRDVNHPSRRWKKLHKDLPKNTKGKSGSVQSNPQLELSLDHIVTSADVFVFLEEWDSSAVRNGKTIETQVAKMIGVHDTVFIKPKMCTQKEEYNKKLCRKSICRQFTLNLSPSDVIIIPCFIRPDCQAEFYIKVYSEVEFSLREVEEPIKFKVKD